MKIELRPWLSPLALLGLPAVTAACDPSGSKDTGNPPVLTPHDTGCTEVQYRDSDQDGYGQDADTRVSCTPEDGWASTHGDCNDTDASIHPGTVEVCNGQDDDCNALSDDADPGVDTAQGGLPRYADGDGDGYGAGEATLACLPPTADSGQVDNDADCDDTNAQIHPDAVEVCNGLDDDCASSTLERGLATFWSPEGAARDVTAELTGTSADSAHLSLLEDGTLALCAGTWYARLDLQADVSVWGVDGSDLTILDGSAEGSVITAAVDGATLSLQGLTLTDGEGSGPIPTTGTSDGGGGLYCAGHNTTLSGSDLRLHGNHAYVGGGILLDGCITRLSHLTIENNAADYYGGGLAVLGETVELEEAILEDNISGSNGGGAFVVSDSGPASLSLYNSLVTSNIAYRAGGIEVIDADIVCTGSTSRQAGVVSNTTLATGEGAIGLADFNRSTTFIAILCDFGTNASRDNNDPDDFSHTTTDYGDDVTMTCTPDGCSL